MELNRITLAGLAVALLALGASILIVAQSPFPVFNGSNAPGQNRFVNTSSDVGPSDSHFMWSNLSLDLLAQAFLIFAAAAGCLALLRPDEKAGERT